MATWKVVVVQLGTGTPRQGGWCTNCLLPSMIEVDLFNLRSDGVSPLGTYRRCIECGGH